LPKAVAHKALPILFADDTSILLTGPNNTQMQSDFNIIFEQLIKWFKSNLLFWNFDKTYFIQFTNKSTCTMLKMTHWTNIIAGNKDFGF
jgi:hypothetical protein